MESKTFKVPNIGCDGCVSTIKNEIGQLVGVARVEADKDTKVVTVQWQNPATWSEIERHLSEIDYAPEKA